MSSINQYNNRYPTYEPTQAKYSQGVGLSSSTINTSSIDQHRNNIQQRIANLQAKLIKKANDITETNQIQHPYRQSFKDKVMQKYQIQNNFHSSQSPSVENINLNYPYSRYNVKSPNLPYKSIESQFQSLDPYVYRTNYTKPIDEIALRQRRFSNTNIHLTNNLGQKKSLYSRQNQQINKNNVKKSKSKSPRSFDRKNVSPSLNHIRNNDHRYQNVFNKNKNPNDNFQKSLNKSGTNQTSLIKKQSSQNNYNYKRTSSINQTKKTVPVRQIKQNKDFSHLHTDFINLNKTISNLRNYERQISPMIIDSKDLSSTHLNLNKTNGINDSINNNGGFKNSNHQLYQMMKSILMGQQKLEKQLQSLKNKENQTQTLRNVNQTKRNQNNPTKNFSKGYSNNISPKINKTNQNRSRSRSASAHKTREKHTNSPIPSSSQVPQSKKGSPLKSHIKQQKNELQTKNISKNMQFTKVRANSAVNPRASIGKGKIAKNKSKFDQLYELALKSKKLNNQNVRIVLKSNTISSIWSKIQKVIGRTQKQNIQASKIYHQNNKFMNDHLINTIQLQKKLQNDLVKKVYDMCENKCFYK